MSPLPAPEPSELLDTVATLAVRKLRMEIQHLRLPTGVEGNYGCIRHPGASLAVPVLADGRVVVLRQYRFAVQRRILEFHGWRIVQVSCHGLCVSVGLRWGCGEGHAFKSIPGTLCSSCSHVQPFCLMRAFQWVRFPALLSRARVLAFTVLPPRACRLSLCHHVDTRTACVL